MAYLDLKLGYGCNNNCIHCVVSDQRAAARLKRGNEDRSTAECKKELLDSLSRGIKQVTFTGGEPTIRPDFLKLLEFAENRGFYITLQSNGRMFSYPPLAKAASRHVGRFVIALHGPCAEIHDRTTRMKGSYYQTALGIKNLVSAGSFVLGKIVITRLNYRRLKETAGQLMLLGAAGVNIAFPHANGAAGSNFDAVVPRYCGVMPYVRGVIRFVEKRNLSRGVPFSLELEAIPLCLLAGREKYASDFNNAAGQYSELKQLDIAPKDWRKARKEIKRKFPFCAGCRYNALCEGVWAEYPQRRGAGEFGPVR